jgi:hypothetical protein
MKTTIKFLYQLACIALGAIQYVNAASAYPLPIEINNHCRIGFLSGAAIFLYHSSNN